MHHQNSLSEQILNAIGWAVGITLSAVVSIALVSGAIVLPYVPEIAGVIIGWSMIVLTIMGVILVFVTRMRTST